MIVRCIDFETTGEPEPQDIVEVGWCDVIVNEGGPHALGGMGSFVVNPQRPVSAAARGVHHIGDAEIALEGVTRRDAIVAMMTRDGVPDVICAHEARFERGIWDTDKRPWLCTRKAARRIWPDAPDHKLQTLRYWLGVDCENALASPPHRAGPDAYVGACLLMKCIEHESIEQMIEWTNVPSLLPTCPLKKHKGKRWEDVDDSYLAWMLKQDDMDGDLLFTARHHVDLRRAAAAA